MGRHTANSDSNKFQNMRTKEAIPSIDLVSHMWLGFLIHEAVALQNGKEIIREHHTNEGSARIGTPSRETIDFKTPWRAFPRMPQMLYPNERLDATPATIFTSPKSRGKKRLIPQPDYPKGSTLPSDLTTASKALVDKKQEGLT